MAISVNCNVAIQLCSINRSLVFVKFVGRWNCGDGLSPVINKFVLFLLQG